MFAFAFYSEQERQRAVMPAAAQPMGSGRVADPADRKKAAADAADLVELNRSRERKRDVRASARPRAGKHGWDVRAPEELNRRNSTVHVDRERRSGRHRSQDDRPTAAPARI